jgi:hypothetical protein
MMKREIKQSDGYMPQKKPSKIEDKETKEIETLSALAACDTVTAAAEKLSISREALYKRIRNYGLTEELDNIRTVARMELLTASGKAARNLISKIDSQDENISMKASTETLDRIGLTKVDNNTTPATQIFNQIQINDRKEFFNE